MKFKVLSRQNIEKIENFTEPTIIISIRGFDDSVSNFKDNENLKEILYLEFDDEDNKNTGLNENHAKEIIKFINNHINDSSLCIVHCQAGISRSAGVCAALMQIVNGNDDEIFNNPKYCPNRNCYLTILNEYYGTYDKDQIEENFKHNIEIWKKENIDF